ncbi:MAG TPA: hypothetical protein DEB06_00155 [Phycisphaerales bacterium]|nr:hypothetical protein [Phycisphaerales bacterium]
MSERISTSPEPTRDDRLLVILVGQSQLEQRLRREPEVELVRARTALDAIGELGAALDHAGARPLVVLAPETLPPDEVAPWIEALHSVDPGAPVLGIRNGSTAPTPGMGGWIAEDADARALRGALDARTNPAAVAPAPGVAPPSGPVSAPSLGSSADFDDERVIQALLAGGEVLAPALDVLRRRLWGVDFRFDAADEGALAPAASPGRGGVVAPCEHRGRVAGWLSGPDRSSTELRHAAAWLARWLALGEQHAQLRTAAFTDPLTGAWNRRYLDRFLSAAIDRARAKRWDVTLLLFDIDNFKHYNDSYGHPAGDEILIETVRLLNSVIRPTDRVARIGGDEFAVVFDDPTGPRDPASRHPSSIVEIARRFQRQIVEHRFPKLGAQAKGSLTISGGLATFPWDANDAGSLLERADRLILQSKGQGKNVICLGPGAKRAIEGTGGAPPA